MKPLTVALPPDSMTDKGWAALAGSVACALYSMGDAPDGELDQTVLTAVIERLPVHLRGDGFRLGFDHYMVGYNNVKFLQSRFEELGSFEAFLNSPAVAPESIGSESGRSRFTVHA